MQRLFPMFPNGWPGRGLLLLRLVVVLILIHDGMDAWMAAPQPGSIALQVSAAVAEAFGVGAAIAGIFLLVGLWTPIASVVIALSEMGIALTSADQMQATILLATIGVALSFLGPGALSVDARLFGRKRLSI